MWHVNGIFERFTGVIAQAQIAAGETPSCFRQIWLTGELWHSASKSRGKIENIMLPYWMCKTVKGHNEYLTASVAHWIKKAYEKYPGGFGELISSWGGMMGVWARHPTLSTATKTVAHPYIKHFKGLFNI